MPDLRPSKWLWGLMPISFIAILFLVGLGPRIEEDLQTRTARALDLANISWANVSFKGRDAIFRGAAAESQARDAALEVVRGVWGVRDINDKITLLETVSPYTWWANRKEDRIRIKGYVPDGRDRRTILGIVKAMMPELAIDDRMKRAAGAPPRETWVGVISFALNLLANLKEGTASLVDSQFSISGEAATVKDYQAAKVRLDSQLPAGLILNQIALTPPAAKPFMWTAFYEEGSVTLGGNVPSDKSRNAISKSARELFGVTAIADRMVLASGAPEKWMKVVVTALIQLSRLESGEAALSDTDLAFEGVAPNEAIAKDVASKVRLGLPAAYKSTEDVEH